VQEQLQAAERDAGGRLQLGVETLAEPPLDDEEPVERGEARICDLFTHGGVECRTGGARLRV